MKLAVELNRGISHGSHHEEIIAAARFIVQTEVEPTLAELKDQMSRPTKGWTRRGFEFVKQVPELVSAFAAMPPSFAVAKALAAFGGIFVDIDEKSAKREAARSGMYYLLRLQQANDQPPKV